MLTPDEQQQVTTALADVLGREDVRVYIATVFTGGDDVDLLQDLPNTYNLPQPQAVYVVGRCLDGRWSRMPSLMERLLEDLIARGHSFVPQRDRVRAKKDPNPDPFKTLWLSANMPFFSRKDLRDVLNTLLTTDAQPILRIVAHPQCQEPCGKSYTVELLEFIRDHTRHDLRLASVIIPKGLAPSYAVEDVAEALVTPTTRDVASRPARSTSSYSAALSRWVLSAAMGSPGKWVFVLDGFDQQDLPVETRELVHALATQIAGGEYRKRMRLLLVDHQSPLPSIHSAKILKEEVPPPVDVGVDDLVACLVEHYADLTRRGFPHNADPQVLRTVATELVGQAPVGGRLEYFNSNLTRLRNADLKRVGGGA
jgi:hypothetical protein